ncbi:MAG: response regulator transcription factor [Lachnospiraceae bacterium]|jgi:two-component system response regulator LytT|nr:response regulator transcription factor [Lachnospiraceae bacterium]
MLRIALCDDETRARDALRIQLEKILDEGTEEIVYEFSTGAGAVSWLKKHPGEIDLLFLDVEMDKMNGMEAAEKIREFDKNLLLVFVTGYAEYVFDGYRVDALDYIMKPVDLGKLRDLMRRVRECITAEASQVFLLKNTEGTYRFRKKDILYFYSDRRKVILVTGEGEYPFYGKLDEVEAKLHSEFVRIHQRYLVNAAKVSHIGSKSVEIEEAELPLSRAMKADAVKSLAKMLLEER